MDKKDLIALGSGQLADIVLKMGHVIRRLDEDSEYLELWTQDGEYISGDAFIKNVPQPQPRIIWCPRCMKDVAAVPWMSQPILVCPDCGTALARTGL